MAFSFEINVGKKRISSWGSTNNKQNNIINNHNNNNNDGSIVSFAYAYF